MITRFEIPFQVQDTRCQLYVPFFSLYLKAHDEIYRARNSPCSFFSFFFSLANILENSFETRLGGWRWMGEKLGRGREKNFLIGRIVEQPSAQSYNFSIVSKLPDSFPRHSARARISDSKRTRDTGAIGILRIASTSLVVTRILAFRFEIGSIIARLEEGKEEGKETVKFTTQFFWGTLLRPPRGRKNRETNRGASPNPSAKMESISSGQFFPIFESFPFFRQRVCT